MPRLHSISARSGGLDNGGDFAPILKAAVRHVGVGTEDWHPHLHRLRLSSLRLPSVGE